ncbi:MAG: hypothetical protein IKQ60_05235 [Candidatus Methanomethylophilaceae archaeon]|nr:hypothetical protein [Candidatus Methanomethylophilaceae archaeon]
MFSEATRLKGAVILVPSPILSPNSSATRESYSGVNGIVWLILKISCALRTMSSVSSLVASLMSTLVSSHSIISPR